jgi:hypothetical protein
LKSQTAQRFLSRLPKGYVVGGKTAQKRLGLKRAIIDPKSWGIKMGKIANALKKFSQERKAVRLPGLTRADFDVLLAYDRKTGHLKNYDRGNDQMSNAGAELLRNRGTV